MSKEKALDEIEVIHEVFTSNTITHYRKYIRSMLEAAYSEGYWKKSDPGSLLHFQHQMEALIRAIYVFVKKEKKRIKINKKTILAKAILKNEIDDALIYSQFSEENLWDYFPRFLSEKEFQNPYIVFKKFFRKRNVEEWVKDFSELISYALSPYGNESAINFDYLNIHKQLQKMIEASHLVDLRTGKQEEDTVES